MQKILVVALVALTLAACTQTRRDRSIFSGALIGGTAGAIIGGASSRSAGGAVAGGAIGAFTGGILGAALAPHRPCYVRVKRKRLRRVACW